MRILIAAGAIILALGVAQPSATVAGPSCEGHPATIIGTRGDDEIEGSQQRDVIVALGGDDRVLGYDGGDIICGGPGDDTILGLDGDDVLRGGDGNDEIQGERGRDLLIGGAGHDRLEGGRGPDRLLGNHGPDLLLGQVGDDRLAGGNGSDILRGAKGNDHLDGGPDRDACVQASGRGRLTRCENAYADLAIVELSCPDAATLGVPFECEVTLTNHGPKPAHYVLERQPPPHCDTGGCGLSVWLYWTHHIVDHPAAGAQLAAGDERTDVIEVTITGWPGDPNAEAHVRTRLRPVDELDAIDPSASNDHASTPIARS